jgi:hypothetical protein
MDGIGDPGDPFDLWTPLGRLTPFTLTLDTWVDDYAALLLPIFDTSMTLTDVELWEYEPGTFNAAFRSSYALGLVGTAAGSGVVDGQTIISIRSTVGGIAKFDYRRTTVGAGVFQTFPTNTATINAIATFLTGNNTPVVARDGGYVFAPLKLLPGTNETYFKNRLR